MADLIGGLIEIFLGFLGLIINACVYLTSTGEEKQKAKEDFIELTKSFLIPFIIVFGIAIVVFINVINNI